MSDDETRLPDEPEPTPEPEDGSDDHHDDTVESEPTPVTSTPEPEPTPATSTPEPEPTPESVARSIARSDLKPPKPYWSRTAGNDEAEDFLNTAKSIQT